MKKILSLLILFAIFITGYVLYSVGFPSLRNDHLLNKDQEFRRPIMRVALVADSHNENELLGKALRQAQGKGINFVIGLGDYTNLGTLEELENAKREFEKSGLEYFVTAGDRDGWESRNNGISNFKEVFFQSSQIIDRENVLFVILDNSDIYRGISQNDWEILNSKFEIDRSLSGKRNSKLTFVFMHKTPFHPQSSHVMGEDNRQISEQAKKLIELLEGEKVDGLFSGDLHFFAKFSTKGGTTLGGNSPAGSVKITTIGAVALQRNFQGPRFGLLTIYDDYSWEVEDVEIRMDAN